MYASKINTKLWEVEHPYYCNEGNYSYNGAGTTYSSWSDFVDEWGDSDFDMNLMFRWDWREGYEEKSNYNGDDYYRNGTLLIFWMGQRKGHYQWSEISVCRADEPEVRKLLIPRMKHLMSLWEPLCPIFNTNVIDELISTMEKISIQKLTDEMDKEEQENADGCYEEVYNLIVEEVRSVLSNIKSK